MDSRSEFKGLDQAPKFYVLTPGWATKYYFLDVDLTSMGDAAADWSFRQLANFHGPAVMRVTKGTVAGDFLRTNCVLLVASDRVIEILRRNGIEGYSTYEVLILHGDEELPGYRGLAITGRGGKNDPSMVSYADRSGARSRFRKINGLRPTSWDGTDLFTLDDLYRVALTTEKVKDLFKMGRVTNCLFEPADAFRLE